MLNNVEKYVHPIRAAIASKSGLAEIEWIGRNEKGRAMTMHEIVDIVNGFYSHIDLVKMDVEGAELDILTNNNDWLKHVNSMVMELHPQVYGLKGLNKILKALEEAGFHVKVIREHIDTRLALRKWMETVGLSPTWLMLTLWKALVTIAIRTIKIEYWLLSSNMKLFNAWSKLLDQLLLDGYVNIISVLDIYKKLVD
jgi:hypothetical protein